MAFRANDVKRANGTRANGHRANRNRADVVAPKWRKKIKYEHLKLLTMRRTILCYQKKIYKNI